MDPYKIYVIIKTRNRINAYVLERKANLFNLALINICGPFSTALSGARYFLKAVDNYI
jgi:hypothetical protein